MAKGPESVIPEPKLLSLVQDAVSAMDLKGDMAELGVFNGGSAFLLGQVASQHGRTLHLFDTFQGMPMHSPFDLHRAGDFSPTSIDQVKAALAPFPIKFHTGVFPNVELPPGPFAFVHLDCDLFQSYADGLAYFWPRMPSGAYLVMDDYGVASCPGATKAADEFFIGLDLGAAWRMRKP
jgi:hypothetical protein